MDLTLAPGILEQIIQDARNAYPKEACGLLTGRDAADRFIAIKNVSTDIRRYEMDPSELIAVLRGLRDTGERLLAIFHSHPQGPSEPSKTDIECAFYPEAAQIIVSLAEPERPQCAGFRIIDGQIIPIELHVIV